MNIFIFEYIRIFSPKYICFRIYSDTLLLPNIFVFCPKKNYEYIQIFKYFIRIFEYKYFSVNIIFFIILTIFVLFKNWYVRNIRKIFEYLNISFRILIFVFIFGQQIYHQYICIHIQSKLLTQIYSYLYSVQIMETEYIHIHILSQNIYLSHSELLIRAMSGVPQKIRFFLPNNFLPPKKIHNFF